MYTQDELDAVVDAALEKAAGLCYERSLFLNTQGLNRVSDMFTTVASSIRAIARDTSAFEEYKKDAERYRWLRNQDIEYNFPRDGLFICRIPNNVCLSFEDADKAIDEAMEKDGK